jgi:hypothetical protein
MTLLGVQVNEYLNYIAQILHCTIRVRILVLGAPGRYPIKQPKIDGSLKIFTFPISDCHL